MGHAVLAALTRELEVCELRRRILRHQLAGVAERLELLHLALAEVEEARELTAAHEGDAR